MKVCQDPVGFVDEVEKLLTRLTDMGDIVFDERFQDIVLQGAKYVSQICTTSLHAPS